MSNKSKCSIKDFASLIGSLISVCPAVQYGLLHTKLFEREKFLALRKNNDNYSSFMSLPNHLKKDFDWWFNIFFQ